MNRSSSMILALFLGLTLAGEAGAQRTFRRVPVAQASRELAQSAEAFHQAIHQLEGFTQLAGRVHKLAASADRFDRSLNGGCSHGTAWETFGHLSKNFQAVRVLFHRTLQVPSDETSDGWYYKVVHSYSAFLKSYRTLKTILPRPEAGGGQLIQLNGRIGSARFRFSGRSRREIAQQLSAFYDKVLAHDHWIDEIRISVNGGRSKRFYNDYIYWTSKAEIIRVVLSAVPRTRPRWPSQWVYQAIAMSHRTGRRENEGWAALAGKDRAGIMLYGPYATDIRPGRRLAAFRAMIDVTRGRNDVVLTLDVHDSASGRVLARRQLARSDFKASGIYQDFPLSFNAEAGQKLEFRVTWHGKGSVRLEKVVVK